MVQVYFPDSSYFGVPVAWLAGVRHRVRTRNNLGHWLTWTHRLLGRLAHSLRDMAGQLMLTATTGTPPASPAALKQSVGKLPYGMAIAAGTISYVVARQIGYA